MGGVGQSADPLGSLGVWDYVLPPPVVLPQGGLPPPSPPHPSQGRKARNFELQAKTLRKSLYFGPRRLFQPTCLVYDPKLTPNTDPKSLLFWVLEPTYLKIAEKVKI